MPQKFFTDTLMSKFIKNMLLNTPLPLINTVREFDVIVKDCFYVFKTNVIKCTKTGTLVDSHTEFADDIESLNKAEYTLIQPFVWGKDLPKVTERFFSKYNYYDSDTHLYLGKYLRCLRDIKDIDLMPFYNCFNYKIVSDIFLPLGTDSSNENKKVIAVPIKFNKTYTIAIDSGTRVLMQSVLYGQTGLLKNANGEDLSEQLGENTIVHGHLEFLHPVTYKLECYDKNLLSLEKYLYLIIQFSASNNSSIVVLEGDYTHLNGTKIIDANYLEKIPNKQLDEIFLSELSLLQINDTNIYAFSNRLIEYLLLNAITSDDEISHNIYNIQKQLGLFNDKKISKGTWSDYLRYVVYNDYMNRTNITKLDINGFVDKDVERYIIRGV